MNLIKIKNLVAIKRGYPDWETMENWIIDNNKESVVVAQLLVSAMEDVAIEISKPMLEALEEIVKYHSDTETGYVKGHKLGGTAPFIHARAAIKKVT